MNLPNIRVDLRTLDGNEIVTTQTDPPVIERQKVMAFDDANGFNMMVTGTVTKVIEQDVTIKLDIGGA